MVMQTLNEYTDFNAYKADLRSGHSKLKASPVPYRLVKEFQFGPGTKGPMLMVGKPGSQVLADLKNQKIKIKAEGFCRRVTVKFQGRDVEMMEFQVDKGSLAPNDLVQSLKAVGLPLDARIVDDVSGTPMKPSAGPDLAALRKRVEALRTRLQKAANPPSKLSETLRVLDAKLDSAEDPETLVDKAEEEFVTALGGRNAMDADAVDEHLKWAPIRKRVLALTQRLQQAKNPPAKLADLLKNLQTAMWDKKCNESHVDGVEAVFDKLLGAGGSSEVGKADAQSKAGLGGTAHQSHEGSQATATDGMVDAVVTKLKAFEKQLAAMLSDPNGVLLARKQMQTLQAALTALQRQPGPKEPQAAKARSEAIRGAIDRLTTLSGQIKKVSPQEMEKYIQERRDHLAFDKGNSKDVPQEGEVGADTEMQLGGLKRSEGVEVEFEPGDFSPYGKRDLTNEQRAAKQEELLKAGRGGKFGDSNEERPKYPMPDQFDVFGLTPDVVTKMMCINARKLYAGLKDVPDEALWEALRVLKGPGDVRVDPMVTAVKVDPTTIFKSYLEEKGKGKGSRSHYESLEEHFNKGKDGSKKPTVVPLDVRGMSRWPLLLSYFKSQVASRFPKQQHLIVWRE